jgi:hypothetical protein
MFKAGPMSNEPAFWKGLCARVLEAAVEDGWKNAPERATITTISRESALASLWRAGT